MASELGKIEKPDAESFKAGRKIYLIPLVYGAENSPQEFSDKVNLYWKQVGEHIKNLEDKIGKVKHIFHEHVSATGEDGIKTIESLKIRTTELVKEKCAEEACLEALEDKDLLEETLDWQRCLINGFVNQKVAQRVADYYMEAARKRHELMGKKIEETIKPGEAAILIINERHTIQFAPDIQVFRIAPPSLDDIYKWLRDQQKSSAEASQD
jgi:hypothetical protein